jgi:hypothetical protein
MACAPCCTWPSRPRSGVAPVCTSGDRSAQDAQLTLMVVVHGDTKRQPVERRPLSLRVDRAPKRLSARGHGPVHALPRRHRRAWRRRAATESSKVQMTSRRKLQFRQGVKGWRRAWDSNPTGFFRFCKLQIPRCRRCQRCHRCCGALHAVARTEEPIAPATTAPVSNSLRSRVQSWAGFEL